MAIDQRKDLLREMEELREKLYIFADNHLLTSQEIYQASVNLDKVIVKYLKGKYNEQYS